MFFVYRGLQGLSLFLPAKKRLTLEGFFFRHLVRIYLDFLKTSDASNYLLIPNWGVRYFFKKSSRPPLLLANQVKSS